MVPDACADMTKNRIVAIIPMHSPPAAISEEALGLNMKGDGSRVLIGTPAKGRFILAYPPPEQQCKTQTGSIFLRDTKNSLQGAVRCSPKNKKTAVFIGVFVVNAREYDIAPSFPCVSALLEDVRTALRKE